MILGYRGPPRLLAYACQGLAVRTVGACKLELPASFAAGTRYREESNMKANQKVWSPFLAHKSHENGLKVKSAEMP